MISIDLKNGIVIDDHDNEHFPTTYSLDTPEAFELVSKMWLRVGWDTKYIYSFSWLGRPIIQLPDDMIRIQELVFQVKPDVIIETGIAHGGSLVFYASLCKAMDKGRVIGVDIEIRSHNRKAIEAHFLIPYITMIEGSSVDRDIVQQVHALVKPGETVMIMLDSNHTKAHVLEELNAYAPLITPGSYIVAMDGIMQDVIGAPRTKLDWDWNNPQQAALEFVSKNPQFEIVEPPFLFNEGVTRQRVTYWPNALIRRI